MFSSSCGIAIEDLKKVAYAHLCIVLFTLCTTESWCRRVRIVYRGLGRAFVVHKNRDLEGNNFLAALGLVCMLMTSSQQGVAVFFCRFLNDSVAIRLSSNQRFAPGVFVTVCARKCKAKMSVKAQRKKARKKSAKKEHEKI